MYKAAIVSVLCVACAFAQGNAEKGLSVRLDRADGPQFGVVGVTGAMMGPAGTLTGAPKVRAMEIIEEVEPVRRGIYGGSVLYADFAGNLDSCIAIRTMLVKGKKAYVQAGAGIVADSIPEREFAETESKAGALLRALALANAH